MYQAEINLQQEKECVLSNIAREFGHSIKIEIEELHDHKVTFIIDAGEYADAYAERLSEGKEVFHVERLDEENLVVTKKSCGAYSAIYKNHGVLRRWNRISPTERHYSVLFFSREELQSIIADLREIGEVTLSSITEIGETQAALTDRQREVVQTALDAGYFEWPRETNSEELATELGVSRATLLEHLRKAEQKLLTEAIGEDSTTNRAT